MPEQSKKDPTKRFTGLADIYAKARPGYPEDAIKFIVKNGGLGPGSLVADVGCGTGISSRILAASGMDVIGIEPNESMLTKAQSESCRFGAAGITYKQSAAEKTGLDDRSMDAVVCAQAFHWFQADQALAEFARILRPGKWLYLMWNERNESDPLTLAYGETFKAYTDGRAVEVQRGRAGDVLLLSKLFCDAVKKTFAYAQPLDQATFIDRAFSASYAPTEANLRNRMLRDLEAAFTKFQKDGKVTLVYETSVYAGRKPSG